MGALIFRPEIGFDCDDVVFWGDEGKNHFRVKIKRDYLINNCGVESYFNAAEAGEAVQTDRHRFEKMAQDAYDSGQPELIIS